VDTYDDLWVKPQKSWKDKRKTQHRDGPRGKRHEIVFDKGRGWYSPETWALEQYLQAHDIPYYIKNIKKSYMYCDKTAWVWVPHYQKPKVYYVWRWRNGTLWREFGHQIGYEWVYRKKKLDKPVEKWYNRSETIGYKVVWWSDKDIGLEYII
jgi:hypothetical protein